MDRSQLDSLAKALAAGTPRRLLLRRLAGGGATLLAALGMARPQAAAQETPLRCQGVFRAKTDATSSSPSLELEGDLTIEIGPTGSVDAGALVDRTLGSIPVRGTVFGRRISLLFTFQDEERSVAAGGTAENEVFQCTGGMYGTFAVSSANEPGEVGSWTFVA